MDINQQTALIEMERALIGALINLSGDGLEGQKTAFEAVKPYSIADIYNPTNLSIYSSVASMIVEGTICTPELLHKRLVDRKTLDDIGGLGTIVQLCRDAASYSSPDAVKGLAKNLFDESRRRKAYELTSIVQQGEADNRPLDDILSDAQELIGTLQKKQGQGKNNIALRTTTDILAPRVLRYLVDDLITMPAIIGVYGSTGHGKSFVVVDMACHIAAGKAYNGYSVKQGSVLYVAAEDASGIERRIAAWIKANPSYPLDDALHLIAEPCLLPSQTQDLIDCIASVPDLRLVILDTLNLTLEGNENDTTDMTAYMRAAKAISQSYPDLCVLIVHHAGKSGQDFARGSVAFKANLDVEFCVRMDAGVVTISNTKVKNAAEAKPLAFSFATIELDNWTKEDGSHIESAVLVATDAPMNNKVQRVKGVNQQKALTVLMALTQYQQNNLKDAGYDGIAGVLYADWEHDCIRQGIARKPSGFKARILLKLQEVGIVKLDAPYIRLLE
jgi:hypothetical protein